MAANVPGADEKRRELRGCQPSVKIHPFNIRFQYSALECMVTQRPSVQGKSKLPALCRGGDEAKWKRGSASASYGILEQFSLF